MKKYHVILTHEQRSSLQELVAAATAPELALRHARILLKADEGAEGPAWTDEEIGQALDVNTSQVQEVRHRFAQEGLDAALKPRECRPTFKYRIKYRIDGEREAHLIALVCSAPPDGHRRWTLTLLAEKLAESESMASLSYETVRRALKKLGLKASRVDEWCMPPRASAEFVDPAAPCSNQEVDVAYVAILRAFGNLILSGLVRDDTGMSSRHAHTPVNDVGPGYLWWAKDPTSGIPVFTPQVQSLPCTFDQFRQWCDGDLAFVVDSGTQVELDSGPRTFDDWPVQILDGPYRGQSGWVTYAAWHPDKL